MAQQIPQMISGVAGGISGAMGGLLQPLSQLPQQAAQIGQQMMQAGMGALQHGAGSWPRPFLVELTGSTSGAGELGGGGGGGLGGGSAPPHRPRCSGRFPPQSAGTEPASAHTDFAHATECDRRRLARRGVAMGGMPMMPPGAMHGAGSSGQGREARHQTRLSRRQ